MGRSKTEGQKRTPRDLKIKPRTYQPKKTEYEATEDMPSMSEKQLRDTFFRPFNIIENPDASP